MEANKAYLNNKEAANGKSTNEGERESEHAHPTSKSLLLD